MKKQQNEWFAPKKTLSRVDRGFKNRELSHELRNEPGGYARKPRSQMRGVDPDYQKNLERLSQGLKKEEETKEQTEIVLEKAKKLFGYDAINAKFKEITGSSLEQRAKHYDELSKKLEKEKSDYLKDREMKKEEAEQIDELNKETLKKYVSKAVDSARSMPGYGTKAEKSKKTMRHAGISRATEKLAKEEVSGVVEEAEKPLHHMALHVSHVGPNKYKVHAVGKHLADGIKVGEHLSDSELDDAQEMGAKLKMLKHNQKEDISIKDSLIISLYEMAKKSKDKEEKEEDDEDRGPEPDKNITVQLKKAADMKEEGEKGGADVEYQDGSTHFVPGHVAHTVLNAMDKMKPSQRLEAQKAVHQSHGHLMAAHQMLSKGK